MRSIILVTILAVLFSTTAHAGLLDPKIKKKTFGCTDKGDAESVDSLLAAPDSRERTLALWEYFKYKQCIFIPAGASIIVADGSFFSLFDQVFYQGRKLWVSKFVIDFN